ncbi:MAG: hypothetical protein ACYCPN_01575 [Thermoplasmata archaeon]
MPDQLVGWVFVGYDDEDLRRELRLGHPYVWRDARTQGKEVGHPVLYLQTGGVPRWVGAGRIRELDERWKIFGVSVVLDRWIAPPLPARARGTVPVPGAVEQAGRWENRTLADRIGIPGHRTHTPFLDEGRDLRLTAADRDELFRQQPALRAWA